MKLWAAVLIQIVFLVAGDAYAEPNHSYPTGVPGYNVKRIMDVFSANELAAAKEFEGKTIGLGGLITGVKNKNYFSEPTELKGSQGKYPTVEIGIFSAYLIDDGIDPSLLNQGDGVILVCKNVQKELAGYQGECKVAMTGPLGESGAIKPVYLNQELDTYLYGSR